MPSSVPRPGWWQATDGQWYPPELHPDVRARVAAMLGRPAAAAVSPAPAPVAARGPQPAPTSTGATAVTTAPSTSTTATATATTPSTPAPTTPSTSATTATATEADAESPTAAAGAGGATSTAPDTAARRRPGSLPRPDGSDRAVPPVHRLAVPAGDIITDATGTSTTPATGPRHDQGPGGVVAPDRAKRWAATAAIAALVLGGIVLVTRGADRRVTTDAASPDAAVARAASTTRAGASDTVPVVTAPAPRPSGPATTGAPLTTAPPATRPAAATAPSASPATGSPGSTAVRDVAVFQLVAGNCIDQADLTARPVTTVRVVPCEQSHTHEVYATTTYSGSDAYDADRLARFADGYCTDEFVRYVGIDYARSKYYFVQIVPTQDSWTRNSDRDIVCAAFLEGGRLTGSVKGRAE